MIINVPRELAPVRADALRLEQVITDFYHVAIRMTPSAGFVRVEAREENGAIRFEVYQSGASLDEGESRRMFEGFTQVAGTWFGLSVARQIVEAHGGSVGCEPGAAEGNTFWFTLPAA